VRLVRPYRAELNAIFSKPFLYIVSKELPASVSLNTLDGEMHLLYNFLENKILVYYF
jgi:hypothetical protein